MRTIEEMSAEELREKVYKFYDILERHSGEEAATMNRSNALPVLIDALDHAQEDHECAKVAILCYSDMTLQMGLEIKFLNKEIEQLRGL